MTQEKKGYTPEQIENMKHLIRKHKELEKKCKATKLPYEHSGVELYITDALRKESKTWQERYYEQFGRLITHPLANGLKDFISQVEHQAHAKGYEEGTRVKYSLYGSYNAGKEDGYKEGYKQAKFERKVEDNNPKGISL